MFTGTGLSTSGLRVTGSYAKICGLNGRRRHNMPTTAELIELRDILREAINTSKRLDRVHENYVQSTNTDGFSRRKTTTFNAVTGNLAPQLRLEISAAKAFANKIF